MVTGELSDLVSTLSILRKYFLAIGLVNAGIRARNAASLGMFNSIRLGGRVI